MESYANIEGKVGSFSILSSANKLHSIREFLPYELTSSFTAVYYIPPYYDDSGLN